MVYVKNDRIVVDRAGTRGKAECVRPHGRIVRNLD